MSYPYSPYYPYYYPRYFLPHSASHPPLPSSQPSGDPESKQISPLPEPYLKLLSGDPESKLKSPLNPLSEGQELKPKLLLKESLLIMLLGDPDWLPSWLHQESRPRLLSGDPELLLRSKPIELQARMP